MKGNRHNVIRALGDFLSGVTRYDSRDDVNSAPEKNRRQLEANKPQNGPFRPQSAGPLSPKKFRFEDGTEANREDYNLPANGDWSKKPKMPKPPVKKVVPPSAKVLPVVKKRV